MRWYCVETLAKRETEAKWRLKAGLGMNAWLPMCKSWPNNPETPLFPGYLFVQLAEGGPSVQRDTQFGIVGLVRIGSGDQPTPVPDDVIGRLKAKASENSGIILLNKLPSLKRGQRAEVVEGPWAGYEGLYLGAAEQRVTLLLDIMGKRVRVKVAHEIVRAAQ